MTEAAPQGPNQGPQPIFNAPPATLWTCGALVLCHGLFRFAGPAWQEAMLENLAFVPARFLALFGGDGIGFPVLGFLPLVGHAFLHADVMHLLLNSGLLLAFGTAVERRLGVARFLLVFVVAAAAGALAETLAAGARFVFLIGASGAVYGMMGAAVPILFRAGVPARRRRALEFVAVILGLNFLLAVFGVADFLAGAEVAWRAHMGGFIVGLLLGFLLQPPSRPPSRA